MSFGNDTNEVGPQKMGSGPVQCHGANIRNQKWVPSSAGFIEQTENRGGKRSYKLPSQPVRSGKL